MADKPVKLVRNSYEAEGMVSNVLHGHSNGGNLFMSRKEVDDLDFPYDIALLSVNYQQIQDKTNTMACTSSQIGLTIYKRKENPFASTETIGTKWHYKELPLKK